MEITRWRKANGDKLTNYVLLQSHIAKRLDTAEKPEDLKEFTPQVIQRIEARIAKFDVIGEKYKLH